MSIRELEPDLAGHGLRIGVVQARFNQDIGAGLRSGCLSELARLGVAEGDVTLRHGTRRTGTAADLQVMAQSGRFDALVALGAVIRGETYHFEIVSNESARGITDVQFNSGIPIANAVLTTENDDQALVRMAQKGAEAAQAAIEMANLTKALAKAPR
jgi:6,7-dimethyl-8-ribityllumazine synthase